MKLTMLLAIGAGKDDRAMLAGVWVLRTRAACSPRTPRKSHTSVPQAPTVKANSKRFDDGTTAASGGPMSVNCTSGVATEWEAVDDGVDTGESASRHRAGRVVGE